MELRDNPIQQMLWTCPVGDVLAFEHLQASEDRSLRNAVARVVERYGDDYRPEDLSVPRATYERNMAHNDRLNRLRAYVRGEGGGALGYLTYEQIAKDLAALLISR